MTSSKRYIVADTGAISPQECPCGQTRRAFVDDPERLASLHLVEIKQDSETHYHQKLTEIYYVLDGKGHVELDGERVPAAPGVAVLIKPGCRHRAVGALRVIVVAIPAFDPGDEWLD